MNDTHGQQGEGWIGFDLDGTLAKYDGWKGIDHIGEPVKPMVELIKRMHGEGKVVKIMTARVAPKEKAEEIHNPFIGRLNPDYAEAYIKGQDAQPFYSLISWGAHEFVSDWCLKHLGFLPEIVYQKDHLMLELYDDRVKQVVPNEGWLVEDIAMSKRQRTETTVVKHELIDVRWWERVSCFLFGMMVMVAIVIAVQMYLAATMTVPEAERKLRDAANDYMQSKFNERVEGLLE